MQVEAMPVTIRPAAPADVDWIVSQLRAMQDWFGGRHELFDDRERVMSGIAQAVEAGDDIVLVAERDNVHDHSAGDCRCPGWREKVGFVAAYFGTHPYRPSLLTCVVKFWWVRPEHRRSGAGARLLANLVSAARERAAGKPLWFVLAVQPESGVKDESLERLGFRLMDRSFVLEI